MMEALLGDPKKTFNNPDKLYPPRLNSTSRIHSSLSSGMSQALSEPQSSVKPAQLACRVRDAGRDFLEHNQTCQWIQFMTEDCPEAAPERKDRRQRCMVTRKHSLLKNNDIFPKDVEVPLPAANLHWRGESEERSGAAKAAVTGDVLEKDEDGQAPLAKDDMMLDEQYVILKKHQEDLTNQQRIVQEQMDHRVAEQKDHQRQRLNKELTIQEQPQENIQLADRPPMDQRETDIAKEIKRRTAIAPLIRRRLKGTLANSCAIRDEGSVGGLIWHLDGAGSEPRPARCASTSSQSPHGNTPKEAPKSSSAASRQSCNHAQCNTSHCTLNKTANFDRPSVSSVSSHRNDGFFNGDGCSVSSISTITMADLSVMSDISSL
ncbi:unnamed protein product [Lymnaea stagnalis]|uniref:Uncharacterized protein n=1 Tax=Lymnaea stagnalis TaxID=6523 RepID=A0AAV2IMT7_LYMST